MNLFVTYKKMDGTLLPLRSWSIVFSSTHGNLRRRGLQVSMLLRNLLSEHDKKKDSFLLTGDEISRISELRGEIQKTIKNKALSSDLKMRKSSGVRCLCSFYKIKIVQNEKRTKFYWQSFQKWFKKHDMIFIRIDDA